MCRVFSEALFYELEDLVCSVWAPYPVLVLTGCFVDLLFVRSVYGCCRDTSYGRSDREGSDATVCFELGGHLGG